MRLAPPPLEIEDQAGFDDTDIFGYEAFGKKLASLVESLEGPSVLALDGGWGSGKTVFARQWAGLLRNRGSAVIYFDAFAADSGDDPLFDIASQLFAAAKEGSVRKDFGEKAVAVFKVLAMRVPAAAVRLTVGGGLSEEIVGTLADVQGAATSGGVDASAAFHRRLERSQERAAALATFRASLTALAAEMRARALQEVDGAREAERARPVVMIVDELDRCRPSYALHLLESLKHVFDVENMCFALITNLHQLTQVVDGQYGVKDAETYLEKFVHATFVLPEKERYAKNKEYIKHLLQERMGFEGNSTLREPIELAVSHAGTSLRGIERVIPNIAWCLASGVFTEGGRSGRFLKEDYDEILVPVVVCVTRALNPGMYASMRVNRVSSDAVKDFFWVQQWEVSAPVKQQVQDILSRAFPPAAAVQGDGDVMRKWKSGSLWLLVERVCGLLDVLGDPTTRRRL